MVSKKHIIFDWNGTLLDDFHSMHACMNIVMQKVGHEPVSADFFRAHYDVPFERLYKNLGFADHEIASLVEHDRDTFYHHYEPMADKAHLRIGAVDMLDYARAHDVQSVILSNHIVDPIRTQLKRLSIEGHFSEVLAYPDRPTHFKDMTKGQRLQKFIAKHGVPSHQTIIVGDSVEEIQIAHEQNLIGVAITGGCVSEERLRAEKPHHVIHSLHELKPILHERGFVS